MVQILLHTLPRTERAKRAQSLCVYIYILWDSRSYTAELPSVIIGASLSEPHIDVKDVRESYMVRTYVTYARRLIFIESTYRAGREHSPYNFANKINIANTWTTMSQMFKRRMFERRKRQASGVREKEPAALRKLKV